MKSTGKTTLTLLNGGVDAAPAQVAAPRRGTVLQSIAAPLSASPKQLELLPDRAHADRLIVARYSSFDFNAFCSLVADEGIRKVVDVRGSPSFFGRGFSRSAVLDFLGRRSAEYVLRAALANPFIGQGWDRNAIVRRYFDFLQTQPAELEWLRSVIRSGPTLLLGDGRELPGSDLAALVDAVERHEGSFKLEIR